MRRQAPSLGLLLVFHLSKYWNFFQDIQKIWHELHIPKYPLLVGTVGIVLGRMTERLLDLRTVEFESSGLQAQLLTKGSVQEDTPT